MQRRMITVSQHRCVVGNVNTALLFRRTSGLLMRCIVWDATLRRGSFIFWFLLFCMIIFINNNGRSDGVCREARQREWELHSHFHPTKSGSDLCLAHLGSDGIYFYLLVLFRTHCTLPYLHSVHKFSSETRADRLLHSRILVLFLLLTIRESAPIMRKKRSIDARYPF